MQQNIIFQCISKILLYLHYFEIVFHQDHFELYNKVVIYIKHGKDCTKLYKRTCQITQVAMKLGAKDSPHFLDPLYKVTNSDLVIMVHSYQIVIFVFRV